MRVEEDFETRKYNFIKHEFTAYQFIKVQFPLTPTGHDRANKTS